MFNNTKRRAQKGQNLLTKISLLKEASYSNKKDITYKQLTLKLLPKVQIAKPQSHQKQHIQINNQKLLSLQKGTTETKINNFSFQSNPFLKRRSASCLSLKKQAKPKCFDSEIEMKFLRQKDKFSPLKFSSENPDSKKDRRNQNNLIKRNSLFLLSFLKTKQKKESNKPQTGCIPFFYNPENNTSEFEACQTEQMQSQVKIRANGAYEKPWRYSKIEKEGQNKRRKSSVNLEPW